MSFPPGFLDELRTRLSLADVIGRKVTWDARRSVPAKGDYWAPCPFHQEKTASFHVEDRKGFYYCFGCHAKGDMITFVMETENVSFPEAVEILAGEAGMQMPARDPRAQERADTRTRLTRVMEMAVQYCRMALASSAGSAAREYLDRRGLDAETQGRFELGYAPGRGAMTRALTGKGIPLEDLVSAGLTLRPDDGRSPFDNFRNRIMFPIRDGRGQAIGFGGRALDPNDRAKYYNSPATPLFDKGRALYNLGPAREAAGKSGRLIVAEGYMDVIALTRAGLADAVAPLGTAITLDQLHLLWKIAPEPILALDGDTAGIRAARKAMDLALPHLAPGRSLRFALMPPGQDPDDLLTSGGPEAVKAAIDAAIPLIDLLWTSLRDAADLSSPERRAGFDADLRSALTRIEDASVRGHYQMEIRDRRAALYEAQRPPRPTRAGSGSNWQRGTGRGGYGKFRRPEPVRATTRASSLVQDAAAAARILETQIIALALRHGAQVGEDALAALDLSDPLARRLMPMLLADPFNLPPEEHERLHALPHIAMHPLLRPGINAAHGVDTLHELINRHRAQASTAAEFDEFAAEYRDGGALPDASYQRLRDALDGAEAARTTPLHEDGGADDGKNGESNPLQKLLDQQIWRKE